MGRAFEVRYLCFGVGIMSMSNYDGRTGYIGYIIPTSNCSFVFCREIAVGNSRWFLEIMED